MRTRDTWEIIKNKNEPILETKRKKCDEKKMNT